MERQCSQHGKSLTIGCLQNGCEQTFSCLICYRHHNEDHTEVINICEKWQNLAKTLWNRMRMVTKSW